MQYEDYLAHYGILGMKWGIRRYQNRDGSLTAEGRRRAGISEKSGTARHTPSSARKLAKQRAIALEKARQAKAAKKQYEDNKQTALAKGTAKDILKFKGDLTNNELQNALTRINLEKQLSSIATTETKTTWDKIDSIANKTGKLVNLTAKGIDAWNAFAKISNSFSEDKLPIIGGDNKKEDPELKAKDQVIADHMVKYGTLDQVLKYAPQMSKKSLSSALERLVSTSVSGDEQARLDAIKSAIIDYGPDKKVFSVIDNWTAEDVARFRKRKENQKKENDND